MDDAVVVRFIKTDDDAPPSQVMQEAYEAIKTFADNCEWFSLSDVMNVDGRDKRHIYIFQDFSGPAFEAAVASAKRIYGPMCVLTCLKNKGTLPHKRHPVFNLAMKDLVVCCTSLEKQLREDLYNKITWMSGTPIKCFDETATHLVAGEVGSKKYIVAGNTKKKIMSPEWVTAVWECSKSSFVHGADLQYEEEYRCPIFLGFVVTVSGLDSKERADMRDILHREGGRYSGTMKVDECTHLVIRNPTGQKYEFAKKWKIHIVRPEWLFDSMSAGYCLEECRYKVTDADLMEASGQNTSTPTHSTKQNKRLSNLSNVSVISTAQVNETAMSLSNQSMSFQQHKADSIQEEDAIDALDLTSIKARSFLDGFKIYLSGFEGNRLKKLQRIINIGGGTRFNQINESVSHVVVGDQILDEIEMLQNGNFRPHVVIVDWLLECCRQGDSVAEEPYTCLHLAPLDPTSPLPKPKKITKEISKPVPADLPANRTLDVTAKPQEEDNDMQQLLSQYMPQSTTVTEGESTLVRALEAVENDETLDPNATTTEESLLFQDKMFIVLGFEFDDEKQLSAWIKEHGGVIVTIKSRRIADYAIVPIFGNPVDLAVTEVATNSWLQMCIEAESVLPLDQNELFTPLSIHPDATPLEGCVLSMSGYSGAERDTLMHIAEALGARCQEFLVRRPKDGLLSNTHLVSSSADGKKFDAAKKWGLPVITKKWLFECARTGKMLPEAQFSPENAEQFQTPAKPSRTVLEHQEFTPGNRSTRDPASDITVAAANTPNVPAVDMITEENDGGDDEISFPHQDEEALELGEDHGGSPDQTRTAENLSSNSTGPFSVAEPDPANKEAEHNNQLDRCDKENVVVMERNLEISRESNASRDRAPVMKAPLASLHTGSGDRAPVKKAPLGSLHTGSGDREPVKEVTPLRNQRLQVVKQEERALTPKQSPHAQSEAGMVTPGQFLDPNKQFFPKFNLTDALSSLDTPPGERTKQHQRKSSLPLEDLYALRIAEAIKNSSLPQQSHHRESVLPGGHQGQSKTLLVKQEEVGPLQGVIISVAKKLSSQQSDLNNVAAKLGADYRWTYDTSCTHYIFQGRQNDMNKEFRLARDKGKIIVSPHWLYMCQEENCRVDESLFPHTYNPNLSLSVSKTPTPARTMRRSSRLKRHDVPPPSPPPELRPKRLEVPPPSPPESAGEEGGATSSDREKLTSDTSREDEDISKTSTDPDETKEDKSENLVNNLKNLMAATKTYSKSRKRSKTPYTSFDQMLSDDSPAGRSSRPSSRLSNRSRADDLGGAGDNNTSNKAVLETSTRSNQHLETQTEQSQMCEVTWDDPGARAQMEMLAGVMTKSSQSVSPSEGRSNTLSHDEQLQRMAHMIGTDDDTVAEGETVDVAMTDYKSKASYFKQDDRIPTPEPPSLVFPLPKSKPVSPPRPVEMIEDARDPDETVDQQLEEPEEKPTPLFQLSGLAQQERDDYGALVEALGGHVTEAPHYDSRCTHLVVGNPTRNEKYLGCVAAGKWVLHKSYFEACRHAKALVEEAEHEWGSEATSGILSTLSPQLAKLARAAHSWRLKVLAEKQNDASYQGAFQKWTVLLLNDKKRIDGFRRLLEAGGAKVLPTKSALSNLEEVSHAFMDLSKLKIEVDIERFVMAGVLCLKPEYIAAYLMEETAPKLQQYYIPEVQPYMSRTDSRKRRADDCLTPNSKRSRP